MKTESISEFLARGGKITTLTTSKGKTKKSFGGKTPKKEATEIDKNLIPAALKISLGIK